jgi:hypothetical protein
MTIKDAQQHLYGKGRHITKRVQRAKESGRLPADTGHGANDKYTDEIADAIDQPRPGQINGHNAEQVRTDRPLTIKPDEGRTQANKEQPAISTTFQATTEKAHRAPRELFFGSDWPIMTAALLVFVIDGASFSILGVREISADPVTRIVFFLAGALVGYAAFQTIYSMMESARTRWDEEGLTPWILAFSTYQAILHAAAAQLFNGWNSTVSQVVLATGISLATAGLSRALFKKEQ